MDANAIIQYSLVGLVLLAACIWIGVKTFKKNKSLSGGCCGCKLQDECGKNKILKSMKNENNKNLE